MFWDFLVWIFWVYILITCISVFISVFIDVFRDDSLKGWGKALWVIFLIVFPFLGAFVYLIARGRGMGERRIAAVRSAEASQVDYIRSAAGSSASTEIESAKRLLDAGTITDAEFATIKAKALA